MLALILDWLLLAVAGACYLAWRLPRDYRAAKYRVSVRLLFMRFEQGMRRLELEMSKFVHPPNPLWFREGKK